MVPNSSRLTRRAMLRLEAVQPSPLSLVAVQQRRQPSNRCQCAPAPTKAPSAAPTATAAPAAKIQAATLEAHA